MYNVNLYIQCIYIYIFIVYTVVVAHGIYRLGIRGTQVKSSIQDIVDEVAPIKKAPLWG
jgi:hypothetical protein